MHDNRPNPHYASGVLTGTSQSAFPWEKGLPWRRQLLPPPRSPPLPHSPSPTSTFSLVPSSFLLAPPLPPPLPFPLFPPSGPPALLLLCIAEPQALTLGWVLSVGRKGCWEVEGTLYKTSQTHTSPSRLLGNDLEEGVSVSSVIENKWTFGAANLLVIHDTGGGDTEVRGSGDRIARDESGTGFIQGPRNLFWSKPFSCSFALEEGLNIWQSTVFFGLAFLTALHCGGLYTSGFGARFSGSRAHLCCFPAT